MFIVVYVGITPSVLSPRWLVQFPIIDELADKFALLHNKISMAIGQLDDSRLLGLREYILMKLNSEGEAGQMPIPTIADDLIAVIRNHSNFLNFEITQLTVTYLENEDLQKEMRKYEEDVRVKAQMTLKECKRRELQPQPPPDTGLMTVKVNVDAHSYSLHRVLQMKDFLVHKLELSVAFFTGWMDGSVTHYFFITVEDMATAEHRFKKHMVELQTLQVIRLEVLDKFHLDVPITEVSILKGTKM